MTVYQAVKGRGNAERGEAAEATLVSAAGGLLLAASGKHVCASQS